MASKPGHSPAEPESLPLRWSFEKLTLLSYTLIHGCSLSRIIHYHLDSVQMIRRKHVLSSIGLQLKSNSSKPQNLTASAWPEILVLDHTVWNSWGRETGMGCDTIREIKQIELSASRQHPQKESVLGSNNPHRLLKSVNLSSSQCLQQATHA